MSFTREEALKYHRDMWGKIKEKYGNDASKRQRAKAKHDFTKENGHDCLNDCYLCEYIDTDCALCPIDWSELADKDDPMRGTCLAVYKNGYDSIYQCAPIDEILALPEREVEE